MPKPVTVNDINSPDVERRDIPWGDFSPRFGRSTVSAHCPFCGAYVVAYLWSLSGGGKRCPDCKAMLFRSTAIQFVRLLPEAK